ncbi:hypothetical protein LXL04_004692 [Taraxacum kok-saghyz]
MLHSEHRFGMDRGKGKGKMVGRPAIDRESLKKTIVWDGSYRFCGGETPIFGNRGNGSPLLFEGGDGSGDRRCCIWHRNRNVNKASYFICCAYGKVELPKLKEAPTNYQNLYRSMDSKSKNFLKSIGRFNFMF